MNPIEYLKYHGFKITSDPHQFKKFGLRNYTVNDYNYDSYCNGYHRAYDLVKHDGAIIPSVISGIVTNGTSNYGNFGATVVIANETLGIQVIYGHLKRNLRVKIGQKVNIGDTIGYQGNTNYYNVYMASHLHIQFQTYGYLKEHDFVCNGISAKTIDLRKDSTLNGTFKLDYDMNIRSEPSLKGKIITKEKKNRVIKFRKVIQKEGHYWLEFSLNNKKAYVSSGTSTVKYGHYYK